MLPKTAEDTLKAVRDVVTFGNAVRASGGSRETSDAYDVAMARENALYETMNAAGMTRAQWAEYDRRSAALYRGLNY